MKYLKEFATQADYEAAVAAGLTRPNVSLVNDPFGVAYKKHVSEDVFIQHIDGSLYTNDEWVANGFANDLANGVAVVSDEASFVIAKNDIGQKNWSSSTSSLVDGVFTTTDRELANTDTAGKSNTILMLATDTSGAGYSCANYTFSNGQKGYLPALGEWFVVYKNKADISKAMTTIGGASLGTTSYWSSTQYSDKFAWSVILTIFDTSANYKSGTINVRAFTTLIL